MFEDCSASGATPSSGGRPSGSADPFPTAHLDEHPVREPCETCLQMPGSYGKVSDSQPVLTARITMKTPARGIIVMRSIMITGASPGG